MYNAMIRIIYATISIVDTMIRLCVAVNIMVEVIVFNSE